MRSGAGPVMQNCDEGVRCFGAAAVCESQISQSDVCESKPGA